MDTFFLVYSSGWATACLIAAVLFFIDRTSFAISHASYWQFLLRPWKMMTFVVATGCLTVVAPYTGDPTWDYVDALFMSLLTFLTAPWVVGVLYKTLMRSLPIRQAYVGFCVWLFSASWSYDAYILLRDGEYPITWFSNIFASSFLYITAGLLWNLDWRKGRGIFFSFMDADWPYPSEQNVFMKILWFALPIMVLVAALFTVFFF